jgi:hypothetical protein
MLPASVLTGNDMTEAAECSAALCQGAKARRDLLGSLGPRFSLWFCACLYRKTATQFYATCFRNRLWAATRAGKAAPTAFLP